jgi:hypothetical protein
MSKSACEGCCLIIGVIGFLCILVSFPTIARHPAVALPVPQEIARVNYKYCNFSDIYTSEIARLYMGELVYNFTLNCSHLSGSPCVIDHVLKTIKPASPGIGSQFKVNS